MSLVTIGKILKLENESEILGANNANLSIFKEIFNIDILVLNGEIKVSSDCPIETKEQILLLINSMEKLIDNNYQLSSRDIIALNEVIKINSQDELIDLFLKKEMICTLASGKPIYPKSINQAYYLDALEHNDITFAVGPAGTGKTFLGVCYAFKLLKLGKVKKIVLVRPVVEAGEKLGFLPGDLKEKIDPYLVPLYDSLEDLFGKDHMQRLIDAGSIEVCPLAYMRGRTLDNSVIILDEAQNSTKLQMKMFLTRLGFNSKMIITGDISQIDLQDKKASGLIDAILLFNNLKGIKIIEFKKYDVMRHPLVYKIVERYEGTNNEN